MGIFPYTLKRAYWEDLRFAASGINPPGAASDPTRDTSDGRLVFSASVTNVLAIQVQLPHRWREGSIIVPHLHWSPTNTNTGNVLWRLEYKMANVGDTFPGSYTTVSILDPGDGVADAHQLASFGNIAMTGMKVSCMILMLVSRIGGDGTDTYNATAKLNEFDIHYQVDGFGSRNETSK